MTRGTVLAFARAGKAAGLPLSTALMRLGIDSGDRATIRPGVSPRARFGRRRQTMDMMEGGA